MQSRRKPIFTIVLVVLNGLIFFLLSFGGMTEDGYYMLQHGAMYTPYFINRQEYYRIFTSMFLHFGVRHLINNMITLLIVGKYVEPVVGKIRFLIIYFISGIGGSALSMAVELSTGNFAISAGASGAIFGLTGALLGLTILNRGQILGVTKQGMLLMIGISLYNGFVSEGVDNIAHIGGLICGLLLTLLLCFQGYAKSRSDTGL